MAYVAMLRVDFAEFELVAAASVISSKRRQVDPESVERKIRTMDAVEAPAGVIAIWASISSTRVPVDAPVIRFVTVPEPSRLVLAVATFTTVVFGVPINEGFVAMSQSLSDEIGGKVDTQRTHIGGCVRRRR